MPNTITKKKAASDTKKAVPLMKGGVTNIGEAPTPDSFAKRVEGTGTWSSLHCYVRGVFTRGVHPGRPVEFPFSRRHGLSEGLAIKETWTTEGCKFN